MLTIDWKERLTLDTEDYLKNKLPRKDYDFEIIFNAYPERVNGKIPSEVVTFICSIMVQRLGRRHADYIPFYRHLWLKKGDYGKLAFSAILAKVLNKKPELYLPLLEEMMQSGTASQVNALLDKVMLPLLRKYPEKYLSHVYQWSKSDNENIASSAINLLTKLIKRRKDLLPDVLSQFQHQWSYPLGNLQSLHVQFLKTVAKLDPQLYASIWKEYGISRDPQIVELLSSSIISYNQDFDEIVENWVKSGNARVKKAGLTAQKILNKKKGVKS
nr:hypothetical protein [Candidatus Cloacimonadota bacterium]